MSKDETVRKVRRSRLRVGGSLLGLIAVGALGWAVVAGAAQDEDPDAPAQSDHDRALAQQQHLMAIGAVERGDDDPGDDAITGVVDSHGELITCGGKRLLVEDRGAGWPIAYLEGERDNAIPMPGPVNSSSSFAARCNGSSDGARWQRFDD